LLSVELEVLGAVVVDVEQAHQREQRADDQISNSMWNSNCALVHRVPADELPRSAGESPSTSAWKVVRAVSISS
jgi:hypothetical protein